MSTQREKDVAEAREHIGPGGYADKTQRFNDFADGAEYGRADLAAAVRACDALCTAVDEYRRVRSHPTALNSDVNDAWAAVLAARDALRGSKGEP